MTDVTPLVTKAERQRRELMQQRKELVIRAAIGATGLLFIAFGVWLHSKGW